MSHYRRTMVPDRGVVVGLFAVRRFARGVVAGVFGLSTMMAPLAYAQSPATQPPTAEQSPAVEAPTAQPPAQKPPVTPVPAPGTDPAPTQTTPPPALAPRPVLPTPYSREEIEELTPEQCVQKGAEHLGHMRDVLKIVTKYLDDARTKHDVIKLNCVNEKASGVKGLLKASEQADMSLLEAVGRHDIGRTRHEYDKIAVADIRSDQLLAECEACVGELSVYSGETTIDVTGGDDQQIPAPGFNPTELPARPPDASAGG